MPGGTNFLDFQTLVAEKTGISLDVAAEATRIKRSINSALSLITAGKPLICRQRYLTFRTIAPYETGTATFTNGSRTVSGSGTSWTSAMEGRWIRPYAYSGGVSDDWYEIVKVSDATTLTVKEQYAPNTASGISYVIAPRYYDLPPAVADVQMVKPPGLSWGNVVGWDSFTAGREALLSSKSAPTRFCVWGSPNLRTTYTVASITGTQNSEEITVASGFLGTVEPGDRLMNFNGGSNNSYDVKHVDSDTKIILAQRITEATASPATTTFERLRRTRLWLSPIPDDEYVIHYGALMQTYNLINDNDVPDLPLEWRDLIVVQACVKYMEYTQSPRINEFRKEAEQLKYMMDFDPGASEDTVSRWSGL